MPIVVGGVGGSRARVVAQKLKSVGIFTGDNLNGCEDNITCSIFSRHEKQNQGSGTDQKTESSRECEKTSVFIVSTLEHLADTMWSYFVG